MSNEKLQFRFLGLLLATFWLYCLYESVIAPPFLGYYTFDESFITDSGVFIWYGKTPRILDWPAAPSVLLYTLIFGVSLFIQLIQQIGSIHSIVDVFHLIDQTTYNYLINREPYILVGRSIQMVLVAYFLYTTIRFVYKQDHRLLNTYTRLIIGVLIISSHLFWNNGIVLRPEAISGSIFIYLLTRLIFSERLRMEQVMSLSFLFGMMIAERLIFMFFAPTFFLSIFFLADQKRWKILFQSIAIFLVSFIAFCPFILTDPLILLKAFFGGIFAKINDAPMETLFNWEFIKTYYTSPAGYIMTVLTLIGVIALLQSKSWVHRILVINWALFLYSVLKSAKIYDPHVLPGALTGLLIAALGMSYIISVVPKLNNLVRPILAVVAICEIFIVVKYHRWVHETQNTQVAYNWIMKELPKDTRLLVPMDLGIYLPKNAATIQREMAANAEFDNRVRKLNFLMGMGGNTANQADATNFPIATSAFAFEDEDLFDAQYQLLNKYASHDDRKTFNYNIYLDNGVLVYHSITLEEGLNKFKEKEYDYVVVDHPIDNLTPHQTFQSDSGIPIWIYKAP